MPGSALSLVLFPLKTILEEATLLEVHVKSFSFPIIQSCVGIQTSIISLIGLRIFVQGKEKKTSLYTKCIEKSTQTLDHIQCIIT